MAAVVTVAFHKESLLYFEERVQNVMAISPTELHEDYPLDRVEVIQTPYGKGLVSTATVKAGCPIGQIHGQYIEDPDYSSNYCMCFIDGVLEPEEPYRLVNHSCDPNCELAEYEITVEQTNDVYYEMWLYTLRDIAPGEQLTIDYSWSADNAIPCLCGSPNCRGWIVDPEELPGLIARSGRGSLEAEDEAVDVTVAEEPAKTAGRKKSAGKKTAGKKTAGKKTTDKKAVEKEAAEKKATEKKAAEKKATEKKAAEKKATEKKAVAKKSAEKKSTEKKAVGKKASSKLAVADDIEADDFEANDIEAEKPEGIDITPPTGSVKKTAGKKTSSKKTTAKQSTVKKTTSISESEESISEVAIADNPVKKTRKKCTTRKSSKKSE